MNSDPITLTAEEEKSWQPLKGMPADMMTKLLMRCATSALQEFEQAAKDVGKDRDADLTRLPSMLDGNTLMDFTARVSKEEKKLRLSYYVAATAYLMQVREESEKQVIELRKELDNTKQSLTFATAQCVKQGETLDYLEQHMALREAMLSGKAYAELQKILTNNKHGLDGLKAAVQLRSKRLTPAKKRRLKPLH